MRRLKVFAAIPLLFSCWACDRQSDKESSQSQRKTIDEPSRIHALLEAHDAEVRAHGGDLKYTDLLGRYGKDALVASLDHIETSQSRISSVEGVGLVFGVAEAARVHTGYDICQDTATLNRVVRMYHDTPAPPWERSGFKDMMKGLCSQKSRK